MQNNLMKIEDEFQEENEINIYDLINIFLKNIKLFIKVTILGIIITCLYIGVRIIFFKDNIQIQANTGLDEDEAFYFGAIIGFEGYRKFCEVFRKVTNRNRANIYFLEEENESYNV